MLNPQLRPDDRSLVADIRRGDGAAETALYQQFAARVYYLARKLLRSHEAAEDVRAETFLRVIQAIRADRLRAPDALPSFVLQTAHNVIRETMRGQWRSIQMSRRLDAAAKTILEPVEIRPPVLRALEDTVATLNRRERTFLRLYFYEEAPVGTIAARLGIKEERVRLVKSRTLQRLRQAYVQALQTKGR